MTVKEALEKLDAAWPQLSIAIDCSIWAHVHDKRRPPVVEWSIWNQQENKFYRSATLQTAVNLALGIDNGSLEEVDAALEYEP